MRDLSKLNTLCYCHDMGYFGSNEANHIDAGMKIAEEIPEYRRLAFAIRYHHERYDGKGPYRLKGKRIPVICRIFAIADKFYDLTNETLKTVGPILFVTAAGGVLGKVIASTSMIDYITQNAELLETIGIFFPFILAAILKSAQGSSTVALTTTAGIVAPILPVLGLDSPIRATLAVMAIGAGAMTVSHANDSYFWVVTNFGAMTPEKGYKTQTMATLVLGLSGMLEIFILSLFLH